MSTPLISSLERAVRAAPDDVPLRLHLAEQLISAGRGEEAIAHCAMALQHSPGDQTARDLMVRALSPDATGVDDDTSSTDPTASGIRADPTEATPAESAGAAKSTEPTSPTDPVEASTAAESPAGTDSPTPAGPAQGFDWARAEEDLGPGPAAPFVSGTEPLPPERQPAYGLMPSPEDWEVEAPGLALADVGGLQDVKDRLEASFLAPMRNPELRRLYGKSLRGGLLLYGPPGVGKTFIARAVAGEMGAGFLNITLTDILDQYIGNSEAKLHSVFDSARSHAPCVVFLDELDAIGIKRSLMRSAGMRGVVNQLLQELDGIGADNRGVYVLAATNTPWDIDPALRRPGRLDRAILVLPPDEPARSAILRTHLKDRPIEGIDLAYLARVTDGLTGADLSHVCDTAAEKALLDSVRTGTPRMIRMPDLLAALAEVRPSTGPWFDVARNVVEYADHSGEYADLRAWMKQRRML